MQETIFNNALYFILFLIYLLPYEQSLQTRLSVTPRDEFPACQPNNEAELTL